MRAFFDSSALAKRYIEEPGSEEVEGLLKRTEELAVSVLCPAEIVSALARKLRERRLSPDSANKAKAAFLHELEEMAVCPVTPAVLESAIVLIESFALRTLDAIHLASALEWKADAFVSADKRQTSAARKAGMRAIEV
ncbi:MAG: type II toxin-antitoxin system VapC family toxin [Candidatus Aminicenantes bacterium]|nr:type II toxin-antitoxin system VapC family toxin [Candidatus Aminicenantes bacterium]